MIDRQRAWEIFYRNEFDFGSDNFLTPMARDALIDLIRCMSEVEQNLKVSCQDMQRIISKRRMRQLTAACKPEDSHTWYEWCVLLGEELPRATYSLWSDLLKHVFLTVVSDTTLESFLTERRWDFEEDLHA